MAGADRIGILAGGGDLPHQVAAAARSRGIAVAVAALDDGADAGRFPDCIFERFSIAQVGGILKFMRRNGVSHLVMAGDVARPDFSGLRPDMRGLTLLPRVVAAPAPCWQRYRLSISARGWWCVTAAFWRWRGRRYS